MHSALTSLLTLPLKLQLLWHGRVDTLWASTDLVSNCASLASIDSIDSSTFFALLYSFVLAAEKVNTQGSSSPACGKSEE